MRVKRMGAVELINEMQGEIFREKKLLLENSCFISIYVFFSLSLKKELHAWNKSEFFFLQIVFDIEKLKY